MRYFTGFLIVIGLIVLLFVAILKSGGPKTQPFNLNSYATSGAIAQLTIDGPINAESEHQAAQVSVGATSTNFEILQGYENKVQTNKTFDNNQTAFTVFLHALSLVGFADGTNDPKSNDERGYCPSGDRYIFELVQNSSDIFRYWATSCGSQGNYKGNVDSTLSLFKAQVPGYNDLTSTLQL